MEETPEKKPEYAAHDVQVHFGISANASISSRHTTTDADDPVAAGAHTMAAPVASHGHHSHQSDSFRHAFRRTVSRTISNVKLLAEVAVAEHPVEKYRARLKSIEDEDEENQSLAVSHLSSQTHAAYEEDVQSNTTAKSVAVNRWQGAARHIMDSNALVRDAENVASPTAKGAARFASLVSLEHRLAGNPHKVLFLEALERKRLHQYTSWFDHLSNELFITGERIFDFFTPAEMGHHRVWFTCLFAGVMFLVFFYMAGEFFFYVEQTGGNNSQCLQQLGYNPYGPKQFTRWIVAKKSQWCFQNSAWTMSAEYLIQWGARYGPYLKSQPSRWFSSWFLHQSFQHVLANMLLFIMIAMQIEAKYGTWRIILLWVIAAVGGNFFSAAFEDNCTAVAGASGGVFGMLGLYIADMVVNFKTIPRPIMRSLLMLAFLVYFIITAATMSEGTSHLSHVGGFLCGLFPAFLFLPKLKSERWEAFLPIVGGTVMVAVYVALPTYFYRKRFPGLECQLG